MDMRRGGALDDRNLGSAGTSPGGLFGLAGMASSQKGMEFQEGISGEEKEREDSGWEWRETSEAEATVSCIWFCFVQCCQTDYLVNSWSKVLPC